jgi:hypothetical protein
MHACCTSTKAASYSNDKRHRSDLDNVTKRSPNSCHHMSASQRAQRLPVIVCVGPRGVCSRRVCVAGMGCSVQVIVRQDMRPGVVLWVAGATLTGVFRTPRLGKEKQEPRPARKSQPHPVQHQLPAGVDCAPGACIAPRVLQQAVHLGTSVDRTCRATAVRGGKWGVFATQRIMCAPTHTILESRLFMRPAGCQLGEVGAPLCMMQNPSHCSMQRCTDATVGSSLLTQQPSDTHQQLGGRDPRSPPPTQSQPHLNNQQEAIGLL